MRTRTASGSRSPKPTNRPRVSQTCAGSAVSKTGAVRKYTRSGGTRSPPPRFNQHGDDVLAGLGYDADEIAGLKRAGIVHETRRR